MQETDCRLLSAISRFSYKPSGGYFQNMRYSFSFERHDRVVILLHRNVIDTEYSTQNSLPAESACISMTAVSIE